MAVKKKSRSKRVSQGIVGSPKKARTSVGVERVLNQLDAWSKGKRTRVSVNGSKAVEGQVVWGLPKILRRKGSNES